MNFPFFIAKRYFFSRKNTNLINLISLISLIGVAFGTFAFIVVLSVFGGMEKRIEQNFSIIDPDLKIELKKGSFFDIDTNLINTLNSKDYIVSYSFVLEMNALIEFDNIQTVSKIKGVDYNYDKTVDVKSIIYSGKYSLYNLSSPMAIVGIDIASELGMSSNISLPIKIYVPSFKKSISFDPRDNFSSGFVNLSGIFSINEEYNKNLIIVPLEFIQNDLKYYNKASAIELKLTHDAKIAKCKKDLLNSLPNNFEVKNRYEQNPLIYKIIRTEKAAIIAILLFIILISSVNIIGTQIMLSLEKIKDIYTYESLGADKSSIKKIFQFNGWLISLWGALLGIILGTITVFIQYKYGVITFYSEGSNIVDVYPVDFNIKYIVFVLSLVLSIGFIISKAPMNFIFRQIFKQD